MMESVKVFLSNKTNLVLTVVIVVLILAGLAIFIKVFSQQIELMPEVHELSFDPEGAYALVAPRRDGNAIVLQIKRVAFFDSFSYQIAYNDETGTDRGAGSLETWIPTEKRSEFEQEILFGTCSKGDTMDPLHCVFDKGVENGTLTLQFRKKGETKNLFRAGKPDQIYKIITTWHLQKPDIALGRITSGDNHFRYISVVDRAELVKVGFSVINDLSGAPKLPEGKKFFGKVYSFNLPSAREFPKGEVTLELVEDPPQDAKIGKYVEAQNRWELLETKINKNSLTALADGAGIFGVFVDSQ